MRACIILSFVFVAYAAPQYNYQPTSEISGNSGIINGGLSGIGSHGSNPSSYGNDGSNSYPNGLQNSVPSSGLNGFQDSGIPTEYNKQFYFHQASDDDFNDNDANERITSSLKKNLQVVFIKSPENKGLENAVLQLAKQAGEDKTAIYVLNKQTDISELAERLQQLKDNNPHKPEVHFVKYKTPEEAANAQQQIQAQYDSLPGETKVSNEGIAPVLNFIRSQGSRNSAGNSGNNNVGGNNDGLSSSYLPPQTYLPIKY